MTKKDFVLIAETFAERKPQNRVNMISWVEGVEKMANKLENTNPRFNRQKFLEACGIYHYQVEKKCLKCSEPINGHYIHFNC